jgi:hypothetical protein
MDTGLTKQLQTLAVVSGIRIDDADKDIPEASLDQRHGT